MPNAATTSTTIHTSAHASPSIVFYELFSDKAEEFAKDLASGFPHINEFRRLRTGLGMLRSFDPRAPCRLFKQHVISRYRDPLLARDDSVFLDQPIDLADHLTHGSTDDIDHWQNFIQQVRNLWRHLDATNRNSIWEHFRVLVVVAEKCV